jgi:hypothetical protein
MNNQQNTEAAETVQTTDSQAVVQERLVLPLDFNGWVPVPDGDGFGWMAYPMENANPDGFWCVVDCEGDILCVCQKETAVWLHLLLNKFEDQIDCNGDRTGYCKRIAAEMVDGCAGMCGSWDEFLQENKLIYDTPLPARANDETEVKP